MRIICQFLLLFLPGLLLAADKEYFDYNFDGHPDYRILRERNGRLAYYDIHLFLTESRTYVKNSALSELYNPVPNAESKEIECFWPGGHASMIYHLEIYHWEGQKLKLSRVVDQDYVNDGAKGKYVRVTTSLREGKPRVDEIEIVDMSLK